MLKHAVNKNFHMRDIQKANFALLQASETQLVVLFIIHAIFQQIVLKFI